MKSLLTAILCILLELGSVLGLITPKTADAPALYDDNEVVSVIVELEASGLLEGVGSPEEMDRLLENISTNKQYAKIVEAQKKIRERIQKKFEYADFSTSFSYSFVMNGISLEIPYKYVDDLEGVPGVKSVTVSAQFAAPEEIMTEEETANDSDYFTGVLDAHKAGYTGKGIVIGIVDTGFQIDHEAFDIDVEDPTFSKTDINLKSAFGFLNTIVPRFGAHYYSEKIPYKWDYKGLDKNVYNANGDHGTHVAGIAGGKSDVMTGVAPDAQFLLMKVFGDEKGSTASEEVILAALDDCAKFGADVVNLSLGSESGQEPDDIFIAEVVRRLRKAGVNVVASAGNEDSLASFDNVSGSTVMNADLFDYGRLGSPGSYSHYMAVASAAINSRTSYLKDVISIPSKGSVEMSSFSSWGPTADLRLKPEITTPGSSIYAPINEGEYGYKSGTSMAAPFYAGTAAIMEQFVREKYPDMDVDGIGEFVNCLMMSTATPFRAYNRNEIYSPRRQGAGFVNINAALSTPAYLSQTDGVSRPKLELGENSDGKLALSFMIHNTSASEQTYDLSEIILTDDYRENNGVIENLTYSKRLSADDYTVRYLDGISSDGTVSVGAGASKKISLEVKVSDEYLSGYSKAFRNGFFIDGFVCLRDSNGENAELSIPFMAFFGDWDKDILMDNTIYDEQPPYLNGEWGLAVTDGDKYYPLGANIFESSKEYNVDRKYCAYSENALGMSKPYVTVSIGLLRNAKRMDFNLFTDSGIFRYCGSTLLDYCRKTGSTSKAQHGVLWGGKSGLINGNSYVYKVSAKAKSYSGKRQTVEFPFVVDNDKAQIAGYSYEVIDGKAVLHIRIKDNRYVMGFELFDEKSKSLCKISFKGIEPDENGIYDCTINVSDRAPKYKLDALKYLKIYVVDYAYNETFGALVLSSDTVKEASIDRAALTPARGYDFNKESLSIDRTASGMLPDESRTAYSRIIEAFKK